MDIDGQELLKFQLARNVTQLYKTFLVMVEDLNKENEIAFQKLKRQIPNHTSSLDCANYFDDAKMEYVRKKILDAGNGCIRTMSGEIESFDINVNIKE
jgi:hypothetical protein